MKALIFHGPGDLRLEDVPRPRAGRRRRRARAGRGSAHRRHRPEGVPARPPRPARAAAEPVRARVLRRRRGDRSPRRRGQLGAVRDVRRLPPRPGDALRDPSAPAPQRRLRRVHPRPRAHRRREPASPSRPGMPPELAAMVEPLACCLHGVDAAGVEAGDTVAVIGLGPIGLMLCACVADAGGWPVGVGSRPERRALAPLFGAETGTRRGRRRRDRGGRHGRGVGSSRSSSCGPAAPCSPSAACRATRASRSTRSGSTTRK